MIRGFYETSEVAELLQITSVAVLKLTHRGTLPSRFQAGRRLFDPDDVEKLQNSPEYKKRTRRGSQKKLDKMTSSRVEGNSFQRDSSEASQTAERELESHLKREEV